MDKLVAMARGHQPRLIVVDRTVGRFEDYRTPEQKVADRGRNEGKPTCCICAPTW